MGSRAPSCGERKRRRRAAPEEAPAAELLPEPTEEQAEILRAIWQGCSCRVLANAGTGKTRVLLRAAEGLRPQPCLFLAYNRDIREEVLALATAQQLDHLEVANYDSLLVRYYDPRAPSQDFRLSLLSVLERNAAPVERKAWSVVFVDEAQDLDEGYASFVGKILEDHRPGEGRRAQVVSVGDPKQNIFRYRGADARFFLGAEGPHAPEDRTLRLTTTFRFCAPLCRFVDRLCAPLFADQAYLQHASGSRREAAEVERWILAPRASGRRNDALIQRLQALRLELESSLDVAPGDRLLVFLSGSLRESNEGLWAFVEELGARSDPAQHAALADFKLVVERAADEPSGGAALAVVRNVHACKGQTFEAVVLFLTNRRSWIDAASGRVQREALYTALTRGRRLLLVEEAESLIFQDLAERAAASAGAAAGLLESEALPLPRCASSGEALARRLLERPRDCEQRTGYAKPLLAERVVKMRVEDKQQLLDLIEAPPLAEWAQGRQEEPSTREQARTLAAWLRLEHEVAQDERSGFNDFLRALRSTSVEKAYARLGRTGRPRALAPHLAALLEDLARRPTWAAREYLELARFHARFHYGYLSLPCLELDDEVLSQELFEALARDFSALRAPQRVYEVRVAAPPYNGHGVPILEHGLYLCGGEGVLLLKAEEDSCESLGDRLLAAYVACKLAEDRYQIRRVLRAAGASFVASGSVPLQRRARYISVFEACLRAAL
jgi:UvrD/REP helicase N-terminal domain